MKKGLPNDSCVKLAQIIGREPIEIIAENELITEKKAEKRAFWEEFLRQIKNHAGIIAMAAMGNMLCK